MLGDSIAGVSGQPLTGSASAIVIGLVAALWAGLGAMQAAQDAMNEVWAVARVDHPGFVAKRLRSLARHLWPRSLFDRAATEADRTTLVSKVMQGRTNDFMTP